MARVIRPIRLPGIAAEENLFQCYRYWPRANSLRPEKEKGIRKSFYVSLFLSLSLFAKARHVDTRYCSKTWIITRNASFVTRWTSFPRDRCRLVRERGTYGRVKCKTSSGGEGSFIRKSRGMRFIESFVRCKDFVISLARCALISVFRLDERWFDILMLARFDLVGKGGIKMLGKRVLLILIYTSVVGKRNPVQIDRIIFLSFRKE